MNQVFGFGAGAVDPTLPTGDGLKELLGGKGAGLVAMTRLGLPVPPGFTITTDVCRAYYAHEGKLPAGLDAQVRAAVTAIEQQVGARFGDAEAPLLVSVRSGARVSMPGMMDTVLNLGLNDRTVEGLASRSKNPRFAWDSYRRFVAMYGDVVLGLKAADERGEDPFEELVTAKKRARGVDRDVDLDVSALRELVAEGKALILARLQVTLPEDPWQQLLGAVGAVFASWETPRARTYRKMYAIPGDWGTAVTVQAMVFGNLGDDCATGVAFTRDPSTGARTLYGEFLVNAQGEDVVAGTRTPRPIAELESVQPAAYKDLLGVRDTLERELRDMQDLEFTIQAGKLWMLQTRAGKRSGRAMVKIAVDLVREGTIDEPTAVLRLDASKLDELLHPMIDPHDETVRARVIAKGLPASPGAAIGRICFTASDAETRAAKGERILLVRVETSPEDIHGMKAAEGILTTRGGMTSHAAVVARGMGKPCVVAATTIGVDYRAGTLKIGSRTIKEGDVLSLNGSTGEVILGAAPLVPARLDDDYATIMKWVDARRHLRVRTNADTPVDARTARAFGAEGIGLCRTEHMFFDPERILAVRRMILAGDEVGRRAALAVLEPMQRADFAAIFKEMDGLPVTIRLLDPPLHEFLPHTDAELTQVAAALGVDLATLRARVLALTESNPMLGHRGCRLAITFPSIYEMQVHAIAEAAADAIQAGVTVKPEIMIPIVSVGPELAELAAMARRVVAEVATARKVALPAMVGTMIELPRACVIADELAVHAEFFSFGTNDLTQTTFGISRDDVGGFLPTYLERRVLEVDPFQVLDRRGVGALMRLAVTAGRGQRKNLKVGICGEHGGDPSSVAFCHELGLDYVSCSPFRVPIARVAAAQAAIRAGGNT